MDFLIIAVSFLGGVTIGGMLYRLIFLRGVDRYAESLLIDANGQLQLEVRELRKQIEEYRSELEKRSNRIIQLETRMEKLEKHQNGK